MWASLAGLLTLLSPVVFGVKLFVTTTSSVLELDTESWEVKTMKNSSGHIDSLSFHFKKRFIFYTELISRESVQRIQLLPTGPTTTVLKKTDPTIGTAVDWINDSLYLSSFLKCTVEMVDLDGNNSTTIITDSDIRKLEGCSDVKKTFHVNVDPYKKFIFFGVGSDTTSFIRGQSVLRADLQGKQLRKIFSTSKPESLLFLETDLVHQRLYMTIKGEAPLYWRFLISCNYDGTDQREVSVSPTQIYYFIIFKGTIYFDLQNGKICKSEIKSSLDLKDCISVNNSKTRDLRVFEPEAQLPRRDFYLQVCGEMGCVHKCLVLKTGSAICVCPPGQLIAKDMRTCHGGGEVPTGLLLGGNSGITLLQGDKESVHVIDALDPDSDIIMDYHYDKNTIFAYISPNIFKLQIDQGLKVVLRETIISNVSTVSGLSVDWVHDTLYWTTSSDLESSDLDGNNRRSLVDREYEQYQPRGVLVDPYRKFLFWINNISNPFIYRSDLEGGNKYRVYFTNNPITSFTIDSKNEKLYFFSSQGDTKQKLSSCNYNDSELKTLVFINELNSVSSMSVFNNTLYFIDRIENDPSKTNVVYKVDLRSEYLLLLKVEFIGKPNALRVFHPFIQMAPHDLGCMEKCFLNQENSKILTCLGAQDSDYETFCIDTNDRVSTLPPTLSTSRTFSSTPTPQSTEVTPVISQVFGDVVRFLTDHPLVVTGVVVVTLALILLGLFKRYGLRIGRYRWELGDCCLSTAPSSQLDLEMS